jgi:hypothetical protein
MADSAPNTYNWIALGQYPSQDSPDGRLTVSGEVQVIGTYTRAELTVHSQPVFQVPVVALVELDIIPGATQDQIARWVGVSCEQQSRMFGQQIQQVHVLFNGSILMQLTVTYPPL